jgi:hypothetical protein
LESIQTHPVIPEKGVSNLAQLFINMVSITAVCRLRKSSKLRVNRAYGAPIANRTDEITEEDIRPGPGSLRSGSLERSISITSSSARTPRPAPSSCGVPAKTAFKKRKTC